MTFTKRKIKILFFMETVDGGGAEKVLRNLVNNMDRQRFDITVQTVFPDNGAKLLAPDIRCRTMYPARNGYTELLYRAEAELGTAYPLRIRDDYDIECAYLECGATKVLAGSTNRRAVKLAWVHCDLQKAMKDPAAFAKETRKYYKKYDKVVCVSELGRQSFRELYGDTVPSVILKNTVDCEEILQNAEASVCGIPESPLVVSLGRLAEAKCYLRLLKAHKRLLDGGIRHNLLILGEGPERGMLEAYIRENALEGTVALPGFRENPYPYLKNADVLACSSAYECFSTFVTEGLVLGKPIVTTDVSGMRELLGDSKYGLITREDDGDFCSGLGRMLSDDALREAYARKAVVRGGDFATRKLAADTELFFENCVRNGR